MKRAAWSVLLVALAFESHSLVIQLEAGERECFMLQVQAKAVVSGNFEVIKPNKMSQLLSVTVSGKNSQKPLYETKGYPEHSFVIEVEEDDLLDMCLANGYVGATDKITRSVGFAIRVTSTYTDTGSPDEKVGSLNGLLQTSKELNEGLLTLIDHQAYMRQRESSHRKIIQNTKTRVYYWTCAECLVLVGLAIWQILYIRAFFETKRRI